MCFQPIKALRRVLDVASIYLFLPSLTQAWHFLNTPLDGIIAFTASICLHPRPLRACAEPQAGARRGEARMYLYMGWVGVRWQRRCKTRQSRRELDNQGTLFVLFFGRHHGWRPS